MYGREELDVNKLIYVKDIETCMVDCEGTEVWPQDSNGNEYLYKSQADKVMDAYEARIKELESELSKFADTWHHEALVYENNIKKLEASQPKWISVNEGLPNDAEPLGTWYIVKFSDGTEYFADWDSDLHIFTNPRCEYTSMVNNVISWCKKSPTTDKSRAKRIKEGM